VQSRSLTIFGEAWLVVQPLHKIAFLDRGSTCGLLLATPHRSRQRCQLLLENKLTAVAFWRASFCVPMRGWVFAAVAVWRTVR